MNSEDIARLAGVSRSTVSRVINNYANVPEATRAKVLAVIEKYNYEPNTSARILAGKSNNTIGLFVISVSEKERRIYQNAYYSSFINAVVDVANDNGYYVLVHTIYSEKDYSKVKQSFLQKRICAGILVGNEKLSSALKEISRMGYPIGIVDYDPEDIEKYDLDDSNLIVVNSKDYEGTTDALNYLIGLGHREIGIITGRMETYSGRQRYEAYINVLESNGIEIKPEFVLKGEFHKKKTYDEVRNLVDSKKLPTALFACNDDMALAAMEVFSENGIRIPEDISIIGFDDIPLAAHIKPALSTVKVPGYEMVGHITELVISKIESKVRKFHYESIPDQLIIRDTCTNVRDGAF
ncbi:LacI family DNA-binding transcriptional regulator [Acetivibrio mesophilus]|uniref:LacI family transcriptional regulator n=1 Tax=Acetivibrio mesophilus TaxID=2487273 RepID=A0A4Q0I5F2_9FIRM|nr:LacI family DNA-binding transcriptional regulator [Acetivibrio mesophilus]ODM25880.1 transcriptional regulator [Clostridium sp. Bc-iso-3]RXE59536.1 LacI family transcriptional regulator [Acetivibrio mesophilus]HHV30013.1 LacI family transcriptional regulator [Clostridium sp.]